MAAAKAVGRELAGVSEGQHGEDSHAWAMLCLLAACFATPRDGCGSSRMAAFALEFPSPVIPSWRGRALPWLGRDDKIEQE